MLTQINPKLPMRDPAVTAAFYTEKLQFRKTSDYGNYLILDRDQVQLHFFLFAELDPLTNYGQVYVRTDAIDPLYHSFLQNGVEIHPGGPLEVKPWGQEEFSVLDPDHNLLTFGQVI